MKPLFIFQYNKHLSRFEMPLLKMVYYYLLSLVFYIQKFFQAFPNRRTDGSIVQLKCDGTGGEVKGKLTNGVGREYSSTLPWNMVYPALEASWILISHGDAREGKWRGIWRMEWVASTLHTTSEHGVYSITTTDAHTSAASSRLNWRPRRFKWTRPFRRKTKSGFYACAITFQTQSTTLGIVITVPYSTV